MARIEFRMWSVAREAPAMPFYYLPALVKFGLLPLLIATICLPPPLNIGSTATTTVGGVAGPPVGEMFSTTDNQLGWRDLIGFVLMLPFAAAFAAAWNRLAVTEDTAAMGRPPIAFDRRTLGVAWSFVRLAFAALGLALIIAAALFPFFGSYRDGMFSFNVSVTTEVDGVGKTLVALAGMLALSLAFAWFMLRLALVIPAAAMAAPLSLMGSWRLSAPVQFRLLGAALVVTVGFYLLFFLIGFLLQPFFRLAGAETTFYIAIGLCFPLLIYAHAIWAGLLGITYGLLHPSGIAPETAETFD
jgi:hypothetical protein